MERFEIILYLSLAGAAFSQPVNFDNPWIFKGKPTGYSGTLLCPEDSLNMRLVGNWSFGQANALVYDEVRDLVFLGAGGGVYILDADFPATLMTCSEKIRTRGVIEELSYDSLSQTLYVTSCVTTVDGNHDIFFLTLFEIWDVSNPAQPLRKVEWSLSYFSKSFFVSDNYVYFTCGDHGIIIVDISTPSKPVIIGEYELEGYASGIFCRGSYAYVADTQGLLVLDVSNHLIYLADAFAGLQIFKNLLWEDIEEDPDSTVSPILLAATLNRLSYEVLGEARLTVYSSDGRKMLEERVVGKGTWAAPKAALPQGVYFACLSKGKHSKKTKLIVVK